MFYKRNNIFIKTFGVLILSGVFFVPVAYPNVASKEYVDRKISAGDGTPISGYEIKSSFIENAKYGEETGVYMNGIKFFARKANGTNNWSIRIQNETGAPLSMGVNFSQFYGGYEGRTTSATIENGEDYNPDADYGNIGYGRSDTALTYMFDLTNNNIYRFSVTVNVAKAVVVVEKLQ